MCTQSDMSGLVPDKIKRDVELQKRDLRYSTATRRGHLIQFLVSILSSKTVALIGERGAGNPLTVVAQVDKLYDPQAGSANRQNNHLYGQSGIGSKN